MKQVLFVVALMGGLSLAAQTYKPSVALAAGTKYNIVTAIKGSMSQEVMGQSMEIPMEVNSTNLLEVKKAEAKTFQLSSTITHMAMSMSAMGQDMKFDSDKKEDLEGQFGPTIGGAINKPTTFSVNGFGKLIDGSVIKTTSPEKDAPGGNPLMGMMNMDAISEGVPVLNPFLNDSEMKVGDSFTDSSSAAGGKNKKSTTYTLAEVKDGLAKLAVAGTAAETKETEMQGMQMQINTTTKTTGEMWLSVSTGILAKSALTAVVSGTVDVAGMSIPISGNTTVTTTVTAAEK